MLQKGCGEKDRTEKEKIKEKEREREREKEREQGERVRVRVLWTARSALKYAPERRAQGALCREKDRDRET